MNKQLWLIISNKDRTFDYPQKGDPSRKGILPL